MANLIRLSFSAPTHERIREGVAAGGGYSEERNSASGRANGTLTPAARERDGGARAAQQELPLRR